MDAFYASVELLRYPQLRGEAVVIGGRRDTTPRLMSDGSLRCARLRDYSGRGVITTATYAARAYGVNSGMGLMKAAQLAPDAILLPVDFAQYRLYSRRFKAAVAELAPEIEDRGIDEIYIDLTEVPGAQDAVGHDAHGGVRALALEIKNNVRERTGLTCSIGVTPNKLLAKIASELDKPDGLTLLTEADIEARIWPLAVRRINGIGPKMGAKLAGLGVTTIAELAAREPVWLVQHFGATHGAWLHAAAHGRDSRPVITHSEPVSISRETTFERDLHPRRDRATLTAVFDRLCEQLVDDLARKHYAGRTVGIKLRDDRFRTATRELTLPAPVHTLEPLRRAAIQCLRRAPLERPLRLLGVRVAALTPVPGA